MQSAPAGWNRYDTGLVVAAAIATVFVHPVHFALSHPYWLDESWVAVLTKAPWSRLVGLSSSSPVGFVALLKLVPGSGLQRARLVVLAFSVLTVVMAYVLARTLTWTSRAGARFAAIVTALVVMLAPASLFRNDLKQYTCDAFCALAVLVVAAWVDRRPGRAPLGGLVAVAVLAAPFSSTSAFVSVAAFAGLMVSAIVARDRRRALETLAAGAVAGAGLAAYFAVAIAPNLNGKLKAYWAGYYLSGSPRHMLRESWSRLSDLRDVLAMPAFVFVALFAVGIVVLVRLRAHALAAAVPVLWVEMAAVARVEKYPFLDMRTSHFLLIASFVVIAIGAAGALQMLARVRVPRVPIAGKALAVIVTGVMASLFAAGFARFVDKLHIPAENVRAQTMSVARDLGPHDVIVVNQSGNFGFSYYWPHGHVVFHSSSSAQGFRAEVTGIPVIFAKGRKDADVLAALRAGDRAWRRAGSGSRLFVVRTHVNASEARAWRAAFDSLHLAPRPVPVGSEPLLVVGSP